MKLRTWLQGAGVASLVLFVFYRTILDMPGDLRMHAPRSATPLALSLVANLILVSLLWMLVGMWLRRTSRWAWLRLLVPALVLASLAEVVYIARTGWESTHRWLAVWACVMLLTFLLRWRWRRGEQKLLQISGAVLVGLGFFWIFVVVQLLHFAMWRQLPNSTLQRTIQTSGATGRPTIVWILFDELSYQQVFGDRFPGLELPNFDEFRKSSTVFTDTQPIVNVTEDAIPSMMMGDVIKKVDYTTNNRLQVGGASGPLHPFNAARTPFALARQQGLTTGVAGWYNPYCSILAPYLNQCYWTDAWLDPATSLGESFEWNFLRPWRLYYAILGHPARAFSRRYRAEAITDVMLPAYVLKMLQPGNRIRVYTDLMRHAVAMLGPSGPDFVFLHLPLPHAPAFYNRKTQRFDTSGGRSYIDNLSLVDKTLGQILETLKQSPRWNNTSVVVCGDHSWRVYIGRGGKWWTPEDEAASHGGVFDPRPFLMVHLAGQTTSATVSEPYPLLKVHDILDDLVQGKQPTFRAH
jgi:Sulfatase